MSSLRNATIKLAFENPEMRDHLLPLLSKQANTNLPLLMGYGLNAAAVRSSVAFMVYHIEPEANKSKFYEAIVVPEKGTGYFTVMRRWGVLMPNGMTTRIVGYKFDKDPRFSGIESLGDARAILMKVYKDRLAHGYTSAFGPNHKAPDGRPLAPGKYPTVQELKPVPKSVFPAIEPMSYKVWDRVKQLQQERIKAVYQVNAATERGFDVIKQDLEEFCADHSFTSKIKLSIDVEGQYEFVLSFNDRQRPLRPSEQVEALFKLGAGLEVFEFGGGMYSTYAG